MRIHLSFWPLFIPIHSFFSGLHTTSVFSQCLNDQRSSLLAVKNELIYDSSLSIKIVGWNRTVNCCHWGGVTCDKGGHVIALDLNNETITNGINDSSSLFRLKFLQSLNMAYNNFDPAPLPSRFGKLTQMSYLNLSNANFEGQVPSEFSLMTRLVTLDLSASSDSFRYTLNLENPDLGMLIQNLTQLRELYLDNMNITTHGYHWSRVISLSLPNLQVLSLKSCSLSGPLNSWLSNLKHLSVVFLDENNFSSQVPESFADLQNLTVLSLSGCNLNGSLPKKFFEVPTLKTLDLSSNAILEGPLPEFPKNGSLENLLLTSTVIGGSLPDSIGSLRFLSRIELSGCEFSGKIPDSMQNLTNLEFLDLSHNQFNGSVPSFQLSKNLVSVDLGYNNLTGAVTSNWEGLNELELLTLTSNFLNGSFPETLLTLPSLQDLNLSNNSFSRQINVSRNVSCYQLHTIDLSSNKFEGPIPGFIFKLPLIATLSISENNFTGVVDLDMFGKLKELITLDLSNNDLTVIANGNVTSFSELYKLNALTLVSCKMQEIPDLKNHSALSMLDLSNNELSGEIPNWIWEVGNELLQYLNLSHNKFTSLQKPYTFHTQLQILDLHSNYLEGDVPIPPKGVYILDYSNNNFGSSIPVDIGQFLVRALSFSISNSKLIGPIPHSICNATDLLILDLSNNGLNGTIPSCLVESSKTSQVINVGRNNLTGTLSDAFPKSCDLQTLDVNGNHLQGPLPQSLVNCKNLEVLDLGNNVITDTFPCWISNLSSLHVFVIRSNSFNGNIKCLGSNNNMKNLQIIDIASNAFSGVLPPNLFAGFQAIKFDNRSTLSHLHYVHPANCAIYYQNSATVVLKSQSRNITKILSFFTSVDFSNNHFQGSIPWTVGDLKLLKLLNLSNNALTGPIPLSIGKLKDLESLDLSVNKLSGSIPQEVADISFLSSLNMSYNQLSGRIPRGPQFDTFTEVSFMGNQGLCGIPLNKSCVNATSEVPTTSSEAHGDDQLDLFVSIGLGFVVGLLIIVGPLIVFRRWRAWYNNQVDKLLFRIYKEDKYIPVIMKKEHEDFSTF